MWLEPQLGMPMLGTHLPNWREPDPKHCDARGAGPDHKTEGYPGPPVVPVPPGS